ncbi:hypothetical protein ACJA88_015178 [Fusarium oxysporum]
MEPLPTAFVPKPIRIVVIGAGISGIQFLKDATTRLPNVNITVYDKNSQEGGTWAENIYPGCACDIPSHAYQYSWNPSPRWSRLYAEAAEILDYLKSTTRDPSVILFVGQHGWFRMYSLAMEKRRSIVGTLSPTTQTPTTSNTRADSHDSIKKFETEPDSYFQFRLQIEKKLAYSFRGLWANSNAAEEFTQNAKQHMINKIDDPQALKALLLNLWSMDGGYGSYLAATVAGFPNFFVFNPPICPVNGSAYPGIERTSDYITRVIDRLQKDRLRSVCIKQSAQDAFNRWVQSRMPEMVWAEPCSSWCKSASVTQHLH